jgi:hypothetical protein
VSKGGNSEHAEAVSSAFDALRVVFPPDWRIILIVGPVSAEGMEAHCFTDLPAEVRTEILKHIVAVDSQNKRKLHA